MTPLLLALALAGCTGGDPDPEVVVGGLSLRLLTPSAVDAMEGVDTLDVRVLDREGAILAEAQGDPEGITLDQLDFFGVVEVEVAGLSAGEVVSGGRSGPVWIAPEVSTTLDVPFLPVNTAVLLAHDPIEDRIEHRTLLAPDGRVLLVGGREPSGSRVHSTTEWWSLAEGFTDDGPDLPLGLFGTSTALLGADLLLAGGRSEAPPSTVPVADALLLSGDGTGFEILDELQYPRQGHCLASVGAVALAMSGRDDIHGEESLEILHRLVPTGDLTWDLVVMEELVVSDVGGCAGTEGGYVVTIGRTDEAWGVLDLRKDSDVELARSFDRLNGAQEPLDGALMVPVEGERVWVLGGWAEGSPQTDGWEVFAAEKARGAGAGLFQRRGGAHWRWWREGEIIAVYGGFEEPNRVTPVRSVELVHVEDGSVLYVEVPVGLARLEVVRGGMVLLTGGVRAGGVEGGAWAVMPWWS